jgi:hypothetical protein
MIPYHRYQDFKKIIWGNETMMRFIRGNGMGIGSLSQGDDSHIYRKFQIKIGKELEDGERSKIGAKVKDIFRKN